MKTVALLSQKGGGGRSTTCIHLAVEAERKGLSVALLDIDPQASCAAWSYHRPHDYPAVTSIQPTRLNKAIDLLRSSGADLVIADTAPHSSDVALLAAEAADLILIPCRPSILDLRAIAPTIKITRIAGKKAFVVLNAVPHRAPRIVADATEAVNGHGMEVAPVIIHQRSSFSHALTSGLAVQEYDPAGKAAIEVARLFTWVCQQLSI